MAFKPEILLDFTISAIARPRRGAARRVDLAAGPPRARGPAVVGAQEAADMVGAERAFGRG